MHSNTVVFSCLFRTRPPSLALKSPRDVGMSAWALCEGLSARAASPDRLGSCGASKGGDQNSVVRIANKLQYQVLVLYPRGTWYILIH